MLATDSHDQQPEGLLKLLTTVRRRWPLVLVTAVAAVLASLVISAQMERVYTASAALLLRDPGFDQQLFGTAPFSAPQDATRQAATNAKLVSLDTIARLTSKAVGDRLTPTEVESRIDVSTQGQADVVEVRARDPDPRFAAVLANTYVTQFIAFRRDADRRTLVQGNELIQRQLRSLSEAERASSAGRSLRARGEELQLLQSLQTGNAEQVQVALPPKDASSPRVKRNAVIAGLLGLVLGIGLALAYDAIDRRIRTSEEAAQIIRRPLLGTVPESRDLASARQMHGGVAEAFQMLRANLRYFNAGDEEGAGLKSVVVTSSAPGEGKTTIAVQLGRASVAVGLSVLLVEGDLRRPTIAQFVDGTQVMRSPGTSAVLAGYRHLDEAVIEVPVEDGHLTSGGSSPRSLHILPAGAVPPNPIDLFEGPGLTRLYEAATSRYDFIIFDTPPIPVVPDAIPLLQLVDGVIVVARVRHTRRDALSRLRGQLSNLDTHVLGVVINGLSASASPYHYYPAKSRRRFADAIRS